MIMKVRASLLVVMVWCVSTAAMAGMLQAPKQPPRPKPPASDGELAPGEVERLFDAYTLMQAQEVLRLGDAQFTEFLPRLKALHDTRRRNEQARRQLVMELNKLSLQPEGNDAPLRDKLKELQELDGRAAAELRRAYDNLDQVLEPRRQARFRVFEQQMERRKFDLMLRARMNQMNRVPK
jgi:uncharacterized membrane protein YccC